MSEGLTLQRGWSRLTLGDVLHIVRGVTYDKSESSKEPGDGRIPILRATNIGERLDFDDLVYVPPKCVSEEQMLRRGDIVIAASSGSLSVVGKAARLTADWHGSFGAFCMGLRVNPATDSAYIAYFLGTTEYRHGVSQLAAGSNINNLRRTHIESFSFPLAPLPEQRRIVAKIEELFSDLDAGVAALERVRANLKRYRAAVLKAAVEGRLTEEWRNRNSVAPQDTAAKLLERILLGRRAKWEQDQLRKFKEAGKTPPKGWKDKYSAPFAAEPPRGTSIPVGWTWTTFDQLCDDITVGHVGPMKDEYRDNGIPFLRSQNVRPLRFDRAGLQFIPSSFDDRLGKSRLFGGELLVVRSGVNVGDACEYPTTETRANCSDLVIARPSPFLKSTFGAIYIVSPSGQAALHLKRTGNAQPHFNIGAMRQSAIPIPTLAEQIEIIAEVDRRLSVADAAEQQVEHALQRAARLRQSILKRAFEGRLVDQDPSDEPAPPATLLQRIKAPSNGKHPAPPAPAKPATRRSRARV